MKPQKKKDLRREILAARDSLSPEERADWSRRVMENLFALPQWPPSKGALFFMTFRSEVDTEPMIRSALEAGVKIALPRVEEGGGLEAFWLRDLEADLETSSLGIREPLESCEKAPLSEIGLVLVPGAAFDLTGVRIGYGGGYYDRFLPRIPHALRVAAGFEMQVRQFLVKSPEDVPVDVLVTETGARVFYRRLCAEDWNGANRGGAAPEAEAVEEAPQGENGEPAPPGEEPEESESDDLTVPGETGSAVEEERGDGQESSASGRKPAGGKTLRTRKKKKKKR